MLPPITSQNSTIKTASSTESSGRETGSLPQAGASQSASETGPVKLQPETVRAIDPAFQAGKPERLRTSGANADDLLENLPAGPPPAFVESLLERQARKILDAPPVEDVTEGQASTEDARAYKDAKEVFEAANSVARPEPEPVLDTKE